MPLHSKREPRSFRYPNRFYRTIFCDALHEFPFTELENTLPMKGIHTDDLVTQQLLNKSPGTSRTS
jgi:hypothetical protein